MSKAFSIEDGDLQNKPITTTLDRTYSDIDCTFLAKPSGDIYKKTDVAAVRQSVKNLLLTNTGEVPFLPYFGGGLNRFLFTLSTEITERDIAKRVTETIQSYEPRADIKTISVTIEPDYNAIDVKVVFSVLNYPQPVSVSVTIARTR